MSKQKVVKNEQIIDEAKKATYSSYLDYTMVPASSVYDYYAKMPHDMDRIWQEHEEMHKTKKMLDQEKGNEDK
jgi:hypothetical protein